MKNAGNWIILIIIIILIAGGVILALPNKSKGPESTDESPQSSDIKNDESLIYRDDAAHIGSVDAKVKIVVFSDYLCPYCKSLHETLKSIVAAHPNDVVMYHRTFIIHQQAVIMAKAAEAANKQDKFDQADDAIFESYQTGDQTTMDAMAKSIGLDITKFDSDLNSSEVQNIIDKDNSDAQALNLGGTPSVFLNGQYVEDPSTIPSQIDTLLK
ncbi:MAG: thioredoxin domain-containing protein [Patescibacteria group bacterium]|jgi:protein-disulfide isomerase